jgi:spectrin beta
VYSCCVAVACDEIILAEICVESCQHIYGFQAVELELDTYGGIVNEMCYTAGAMVAAKHPDAHAISMKQQMLQQQMCTLHRLATLRQQRLMESMYCHEYFLESAELEQWIQEQVQTAASEDYGQDYEHLLVSGLSILFVNWPVALCYHSQKINTMEMDRGADDTCVS